MLWIALGLAFALYLVPVRIASRVDINRTPTLQAVLTIWRWRLQYDAVIERAEGKLLLSVRRRGAAQRVEESVDKWPKFVKALRAFFGQRPALSRYLRKTMRFESLRAVLRIGAGDAAHTALLYGACGMAAQVASQWLERRVVRPRIRVLADYARPIFLASADCIIMCRLGHIITAALLALAEGVWQRVRQKGIKKAVAAWKSILSKV